ncbi:hypothetical protein B0H17DRAFT_1140150 [Mycena rosella]|uniref:Uncharacterized protein n=1 Tax=Mycena rosella TaxID=1033263 RepID=A0AAD7D2I8_MYCRO|nr:hypothetical protein B0H17DRAFT_1140150 [Mycena rosella]
MHLSAPEELIHHGYSLLGEGDVSMPQPQDPSQAKAKWFGPAWDFTGPKPLQAGPKPRPSGQAKAKTSLLGLPSKTRITWIQVPMKIHRQKGMGRVPRGAGRQSQRGPCSQRILEMIEAGGGSPPLTPSPILRRCSNSGSAARRSKTLFTASTPFDSSREPTGKARSFARHKPVDARAVRRMALERDREVGAALRNGTDHETSNKYSELELPISGKQDTTNAPFSYCPPPRSHKKKARWRWSDVSASRFSDLATLGKILAVKGLLELKQILITSPVAHLDNERSAASSNGHVLLSFIVNFLADLSFLVSLRYSASLERSVHLRDEQNVPAPAVYRTMINLCAWEPRHMPAAPPAGIQSRLVPGWSYRELSWPTASTMLRPADVDMSSKWEQEAQRKGGPGRSDTAGRFGARARDAKRRTQIETRRKKQEECTAHTRPRENQDPCEQVPHAGLREPRARRGVDEHAERAHGGEGVREWRLADLIPVVVDLRLTPHGLINSLYYSTC